VAFEVVVDVPGVEKKDIHVSLGKDRTLTVTAERKGGSVEEGRNYRRMERYSGVVSRSIALSENIDSERVHADYKQGVLHIKLPKIHVDIDPVEPSAGEDSAKKATKGEGRKNVAVQ
jgi:HSP20 family protein